VAGSDVAHFYPAMLEKRKKVQAARRRSDKEIVRLFYAPYRPAHLEPQYDQIQQNLVALFRLDQLFDAME
jgi:hypothetical protein